MKRILSSFFLIAIFTINPVFTHAQFMGGGLVGYEWVEPQPVKQQPINLPRDLFDQFTKNMYNRVPLSNTHIDAGNGTGYFDEYGLWGAFVSFSIMLGIPTTIIFVKCRRLSK